MLFHLKITIERFEIQVFFFFFINQFLDCLKSLKGSLGYFIDIFELKK
jgi:hypothetical protein